MEEVHEDNEDVIFYHTQVDLLQAKPSTYLK